MNLWRIKDGMPSVADGLLVAGGMMGDFFLLTAVFDPFLNYFEPRGLLYLGYAILFIAFGALGGFGFLVFWRNQKKLRVEIRVPRLVFAFAVPPLFLLFHSIAISWLFPFILPGKISLEDAYRLVGVTLVIGFALLYTTVVRAALRWPTRTTMIALWFNVGMGALGVTAKFLKLILQK
jgi:hypothetical protein